MPVMIKKGVVLEKQQSKEEQIVSCLLLNRILLSQKNPSRKTHKQIAKRLNCDIMTVRRAEHFVLQKLNEKIAILKIMVKLK